MIRVNKFIDYQHQFFKVSDKQKCKMCVPFASGKVNVIFGNDLRNGIHANIETILKYKKFDASFKSYSDEPFSATVGIVDLAPGLKLMAHMENTNSLPICSKVSYHHQFSDLTFHQSASFIYNINQASSLDLHAYSAFSWPKFATRVEVITAAHKIAFDSYFRIFDWGIQGINLTGDYSKMQLANAELVSKIILGSSSFDSSFVFITRSLDLSMKHRFNDVLKVGTSFAADHIGHGATFSAQAAAKVHFDESSYLKVVLTSKPSLMAMFVVNYQDFVQMKFTSDTLFSANGNSSKFGASITFDLSNLKRQKVQNL